LEDEGILGYAGLMPKIKEQDGTVDTSVDTFLTQLKKQQVIIGIVVFELFILESIV
jgi:ribosomal protein L1